YRPNERPFPTRLAARDLAGDPVAGTTAAVVGSVRHQGSPRLRRTPAGGGGERHEGTGGRLRRADTPKVPTAAAAEFVAVHLAALSCRIGGRRSRFLGNRDEKISGTQGV
ncbi:hypothetical protein EJB05_47715, partial [Eragrostis curvula]